MIPSNFFNHCSVQVTFKGEHHPRLYEKMDQRLLWIKKVDWNLTFLGQWPPKSLAILLQSLQRVLMTVSISVQDKVSYEHWREIRGFIEIWWGVVTCPRLTVIFLAAAHFSRFMFLCSRRPWLSGHLMANIKLACWQHVQTSCLQPHNSPYFERGTKKCWVK